MECQPASCGSSWTAGWRSYEAAIRANTGANCLTTSSGSGAIQTRVHELERSLHLFENATSGAAEILKSRDLRSGARSQEQKKTRGRREPPAGLFSDELWSFRRLEHP